VVVNFTIENDHRLAIFRKDGLITGDQVNNLQTGCSQGADLGSKNPLLIRPTMEKRLRRILDALMIRRPVFGRESNDAAQVSLFLFRNSSAPGSKCLGLLFILRPHSSRHFRGISSDNKTSQTAASGARVHGILKVQSRIKSLPGARTKTYPRKYVFMASKLLVNTSETENQQRKPASKIAVAPKDTPYLTNKLKKESQQHQRLNAGVALIGSSELFWEERVIDERVLSTQETAMNLSRRGLYKQAIFAAAIGNARSR
jgi:hypothetical protein